MKRLPCSYVSKYRYSFLATVLYCLLGTSIFIMNVKKEVVEKIALAAKGINFETGSDKILAESFDDLDNLVKILNEYKEAKVSIEGHTDNVGVPAENLTLSQKRSDAVKAYLVSAGISETRLTATGYGDTKPIADNKTKAGKAKNRRVDFKLAY